jgi:hypothetical protein
VAGDPRRRRIEGVEAGVEVRALARALSPSKVDERLLFIRPRQCNFAYAREPPHPSAPGAFPFY